MQAALCHAFGKPLVVEDVEIDPPGPGEVRVRIAACAICHSDIHAIEGAWGGTLPVIYGHEAAGTIESIGMQVTDFGPGDHVVVTLLRSCGRCFFCAQGSPYLCEGTFELDGRDRIRTSEGAIVHQGFRTAAFAEYTVVEQSQVVRIPASVPFDSASLLACGVITGLGAVVNTARVPPGSSVAVIGTGGVGLNSVQGALLCGAQPIIGIDIAAGKLTAARDFGATHTFDARDPDLVAHVRALSGQRGVDYAFVTVGNASAIEQGVSLLRREGTLVVVGMPPVGAKAQLEAVDVADQGLRILGSKMGSTRLGIDVPRLVALYRQGRLKLDELITARYPLAQINEAIAAVKHGAARRNVIVF